mmetsp:Transcript_59259/g.117423  ORF Transcript_59259/g.117423 Transcript_59259/m.117423 type:complete len:119 (-) Transcript_59259:1119-1475(-)
MKATTLALHKTPGGQTSKNPTDETLFGWLICASRQPQESATTPKMALALLKPITSIKPSPNAGPAALPAARAELKSAMTVGEAAVIATSFGSCNVWRASTSCDGHHRCIQHAWQQNWF